MKYFGLVVKIMYMLLNNFTQVIFWDWRNNKRIACLEDSHVDDVTQVCASLTD